ncbi:hypothetical protein DSO57_1010435 [Entomophthora muscae]|uniref:Uncharacterized protein n=1 Tax=Entomophthora muscae TaxID=34485 RepID=A0ACC2RXK4_9FUNG|nr:hypothetical protein DSO57_1010435 [Entomophthora muscae]
MNLIYGIGCAVSRDTLYALGGNQGNVGRDLDLTYRSTWNSFILKETIGMNPSVASTEDGLYLVGGDDDPLGIHMRFFDAQEFELKQLHSIKTIQKGFPSRTSLVRNDLIPTDYISFGGDQTNMTLPGLREYDSVRGKWTLEFAHFNTQDHFAAFNKGFLYIISGQDHTTVHIYDVRTKLWSTEETKGDHPPQVQGLTTTYHKSHAYAVLDSSLFILDLLTLTWSSHKISGFTGRTHGCLAFYKDNLIHAFGSSSDKVDDMQWIDLQCMCLTEHTSMIPLLIAVGLIIGFGIVLLIMYVVNERKKPQRLLPPQMLTQPIWANSILSIDSDFTHYPEVDDEPNSIFIRRRTFSLPAYKQYVTDKVFPGVVRSKCCHPKKPAQKPRPLAPIIDLNPMINHKRVMAKKIESERGADALHSIIPTFTAWVSNPDLIGNQATAYGTTIGGICKSSKYKTQESHLIKMHTRTLSEQF